MTAPIRSPPGDPPRRVAIRLLGGFAVAIDAVEVPAAAWPGLRATQLVQLLSLADGHRLPREQVIDALWPRLDPEAGAANLRKAAHHARQALGDAGSVVLQGGQVLLWPSATLEVDAMRFERRAAAALTQREPAACADVAAAYGGELLPESPYEAWTDAARARLRALHLELLRAGAQWERLALADAADEPAHRELMNRELAAGNRAAAIRWYSHLRTALQQTLGVLPDGQTEALYDRCVAGLRAAGPAFVGRRMELAQAAAWLGTDPGERAGALLVRGPAGIGKSAFCHELAERARERGWTVVHVDGVLPGRPYALVAAALGQLIPAQRSLLDAVGAPARAVLALLSPLAAPAPALPGPIGRHQVLGAFRRALLAASGGRPVLLLVDDAHLVDAGDADLLMHLVAAGGPVRVALAVRAPSADSPLTRGLARLRRGGHLETIDLGPLPDDELTELITLAARGSAGSPAPAAVERMVRLAEGNAFAALELARHPEDDARRPHDAREAIAARLCDVDDGTLALLRGLALAGESFDSSVALAFSGTTEAQTHARLDRALAAGVLVVAEARYRFRHDLVRQALVDQIPPHQRLKLHRESARRLAQLDAPPALVARQWLAGGSVAEAVPWLLAAARDAVRLGAFMDALVPLEPLLAFRPDHAEALRLRAEALEAVGDPAAVAAYRAAAAVAEPTAADELRAKGALAQIKQGDPKGALEALVGVAPTTVEGRLAEALAYSGAAALGFADPAIGTVKAAEARRLALRTGDTASIVIASWAQAAAAHARGDLHGSVWADLHETHQVPHLAVRVFDGHLCITQRFLYGARPYPEVITFADALAAEARRLGAARGEAFGVTLRGEAEWLAGDLDAAEQHLLQGGRMHRAIGGAVGEALALQRRAEIAIQRRRHAAARELLDEALDLARQTDIGFHLLDRIYGTRIALQSDPAAALAVLEEAEEAVRGPLETCPGCRITFAVPAAIAAARARRLDLAERYEPAVAYLANVVMRLPAWHAALDEVRGHIAWVRGDGEGRAAQHFAAAARRFRAAGQPLDAARCEALAVEAG